ncbi:MAG: imidazolonepropionase [Chitinophagaceae bacterium]|nr:MAG: imidazolonepropionase [Chitinophagaceae bacterium]
MTTLFTNIRKLVGCRDTWPMLRGADLAQLPSIENAFLVVENGHIASYGPMSEFTYRSEDFSRHTDARGKMILPAWCDSHTHLVFSGSREEEFVDKIRGLSYADIAAKGGGILNSAQKLNETTEEELYQQSLRRLEEVIRLGTGAIEIKSGYGLTVEGELKMLRVIRRLKNAVKIPVKATFLGAHAIPSAYKENREGYLDLLINEMLPRIGKEGLADYLDVFCEKGFFNPEETEKLCLAGKGFGLKPKLHVNQLNSIGGIEAGLKHGAISLDHLETMTPEDIQALALAPATVATLLPSAAFFLRMPFQPARSLIDAGCTVALASDFNPGSSPSGNMNLVVALSCIQMRMLPEEAINAATLNGAHAMEVADKAGSISVGKLANLILTKPIPSLAYLPYAFGTNLVENVMVCGEWQN